MIYLLLFNFSFVEHEMFTKATLDVFIIIKWEENTTTTFTRYTANFVFEEALSKLVV